MDGADDGESHYDETHVHNDCKVSCELVNPVVDNGFGIVNEHMHARISHNRVNENYVDFKFDEEPLIGDDWLHMVQHKSLIDMMLFGESHLCLEAKWKATCL